MPNIKILLIFTASFFFSCNSASQINQEQQGNAKRANPSCCDCDEAILNISFDKFEKVISEYNLNKVLTLENNGDSFKILTHFIDSNVVISITTISPHLKNYEPVPHESLNYKLLFLFDNDSVSTLTGTRTWTRFITKENNFEQSIDFTALTMDRNGNISYRNQELLVHRILNSKVKSIRIIIYNLQNDFDLSGWEETYFMKIFQCLYNKYGLNAMYKPYLK
ncbi:MAG: hypothetical protein IPG01_10510 [Chitinophagaceae bacterium]|nr:hypothetical protein [Chitinophagaceae bacterium]